ncbi:MAG: hypothetical protein JWQ95_305, partial [Sphaerisporangium sp.]|nr:hypothetical protein [Sphaerisporangium sp.]
TGKDRWTYTYLGRNPRPHPRT